MPSLTTNNARINDRQSSFEYLIPSSNVNQLNNGFIVGGRHTLDSLRYVGQFLFRIIFLVFGISIPYYVHVYMYSNQQSALDSIFWSLETVVVSTIPQFIIIKLLYKLYFIESNKDNSIFLNPSIVTISLIIFYIIHELPVYFSLIIEYCFQKNTFLYDSISNISNFYVIPCNIDDEFWDCSRFRVFLLYAYGGYFSFFGLLCSILIYILYKYSCCINCHCCNICSVCCSFCCNFVTSCWDRLRYKQEERARKRRQKQRAKGFGAGGGNGGHSRTTTATTITTATYGGGGGGLGGLGSGGIGIELKSTLLDNDYSHTYGNYVFYHTSNKTKETINIEDTKTSADDIEKFSNQARLLLQEWNLKLLSRFIGYFSIYCIFYILIYFMQGINDNIIKDYWPYWYLLFLIFIIISKYLFKKFARKIDRKYIAIHEITYGDSNNIKDMFDNRHKHHHHHHHRNNNKHNNNNNNRNKKRVEGYFLSFEWLNELFFSIIYFRIYREYVCYYLPSMNGSDNNYNIWFLIFSMFLHLFSEIIESLVKVSRRYYYFTTNMYDKYIVNGNNNNTGNNNNNNDGGSVNVVIKFWISKWLKDDSTVEQWQIRCSIDIVTRMVVSIITGIFQSVFIPIAGEKHYKYLSNNDNNNDNNGIWELELYNGIMIGVEIIYFIILVFVCHNTHQINIFYPFEMIYDMQTRNLIITWLLCFYASYSMTESVFRLPHFKD